MAENTAGSEADQGGAGAPTPGTAADTGAGTVDNSDLIAQRDALVREVASYQSGRDKLRAEIEALEKSRQEGAGQPPAPQNAPPQGEYLTRNDLLSTLQAMEETRVLTEALSKEYPHADPSLLRKGLEYGSPEQFRAAVMQSHEARSQERQSLRQEWEAELREKMGAEADRFLAPAPGAGSPEPTPGALTAEQYLGLSFAEKDKIYRDNPEMVKKLLGQ